MILTLFWGVHTLVEQSCVVEKDCFHTMQHVKKTNKQNHNQGAAAHKTNNIKLPFSEVYLLNTCSVS